LHPETRHGVAGAEAKHGRANEKFSFAEETAARTGRSRLTAPAERALFTQRRKEIYEALHPETRHGGDRRSENAKTDQNAKSAFCSETAARTGRSRLTAPAERALFTQRRKEIYEALHPETRAQVAGGRGRQGTASENFAFAEETSARSGRSRRTAPATGGFDPG